jgi:hypothetical protein
MQVAVRITGDSIKIINLHFDKPDAPPIQGDPDELLELWQKKLALRLDEKTGKIEPLYQ